jgi:hypothetical protein
VARWFLDADVGAVAGEKRVAGTTGEAAYWRFEGWLKRNETRLGTTIGMSGGLVAVRKGTFRDLPLGLIPDDFWIALDVAERGMRVIYEPDAVWSDESDEENPPWARDWERRTRVVVGTLDLAWRRRRLLRPGSGVAGQLWGHRVIRSSFGPLAHGALLWIAVARFPRSPLARVFVLGHTAAAVALGRKIRGARLSAPEKMLAHLLLLQAVALGGLVRYARGDRAGLWPKDERPPTPAT